MDDPRHKAEEPHRDHHSATFGASAGEKRDWKELGQMNVRYNTVGAPALVVPYHDEPGS
jgi:hypothetical protein